MNVALTAGKKNIIIHEGTLEIYFSGLIQTIEQYDLVLTSTLRFLSDEGFLEVTDGDGNVKIQILNDVHIIDAIGKQVFREKCQ